MSKKEMNKLEELFKKALESNSTLSVEEVKEFQGLLKKLEKGMKTEKESDDKEALSEVIQRGANLGIMKFTLELAKKRFNEEDFKKKGASKKFEELADKIDAFEKKASVQGVMKTAEKKKEKEDFNSFHEEYCNKYGKSI